jgi:large subunit ribosomal protein L4
MSKGLIVSETADENLYLAARNIRYLDVTDVAGVSAVDLVSADKVLMTVGALRALEEWLA